MVKHNKKRNTAFIYEALVREVVKQSMDKNTEKRNIAINIIKESFMSKTELRKELILYKTLLETKNLNEKIAEKLLREVKEQHTKIDQKKLFKEQSVVISKINKNISKSVFSNFVPNYKSLATIAQMFGDVENPKAKVLLETRLLTKLTERKKQKKVNARSSSLIVKSFVKRFNDTYADLLEEQKSLLSNYVSSFEDDGTEFKFYLNEELGRLKMVVEKANALDEIKNDKNLQQKLSEVSKVLEGFSRKPVDKDMLLQIMKLQNLAKEIQS